MNKDRGEVWTQPHGDRAVPGRKGNRAGPEREAGEDLSKLVGGFLSTREPKVMKWQERLHRNVVDMVREGSRVIDIGCGDGTLLNVLRARKGVVGDGVEIDVERFEEALADGHDMLWEDADEH